MGLSRGRGISLVTSLRDVDPEEPVVVQRYLTNPLLIHVSRGEQGVLGRAAGEIEVSFRLDSSPENALTI